MYLIVSVKSNVRLILVCLQDAKAISLVGTIDKSLINAIDEMSTDELMLRFILFIGQTRKWMNFVATNRLII